MRLTNVFLLSYFVLTWMGKQLHNFEYDLIVQMSLKAFSDDLIIVNPLVDVCKFVFGAAYKTFVL